MIQSISEYLRLLKKELAGSDPATIQDALSDSEEYLRAAFQNAVDADPSVRESDALLPIIEKYGSPEEIAVAYRETERRIPPALSELRSPEHPSWLGRFFGVFADVRTWGALFYLILSLGTGIIYFTWAVTGISLSGGLIILIIGLPFLFLFLLSMRGIAFLEGRIIESLLGIQMPRKLQFSWRNLGWWERLKRLLTEKSTWTAIGYSIVMLPLGIIYFTVFVTLIALSIGGTLAGPIAELAFDKSLFEINGTEYHMAVWLMPLSIIGGVILLTATMHLARLVGRVHGALAKAMLVTN